MRVPGIAQDPRQLGLTGRHGGDEGHPGALGPILPGHDQEPFDRVGIDVRIARHPLDD